MSALFDRWSLGSDSSLSQSTFISILIYLYQAEAKSHYYALLPPSTWDLTQSAINFIRTTFLCFLCSKHSLLCWQNKQGWKLEPHVEPWRPACSRWRGEIEERETREEGRGERQKRGRQERKEEERGRREGDKRGRKRREAEERETREEGRGERQKIDSKWVKTKRKS